LTVLHYYGYNNDKINEQTIIDALGTDMDGTDNAGVENGLHKLGMVFEPVIDVPTMQKHLDAGHPVVVCAVTYPQDWHYMVVVSQDDGNYIISDPWSVNLVKVDKQVFDSIWHEQDGSRWGAAVLGEAKYRREIAPMDVKLARELFAVARMLG
jgi:ABC-type bacteriocin/lantibiotic exporter with double-glycine peptidase domain